MSLTRDMQELMHRVRRTPGYEVKLTKGGHWQVRDLEGHILVTAGSTPSDWRAIKNVISQLRNAGVPLNGRTKYESKPDDKPALELDLPPSQARLVANINNYLHEQGFDDKLRRNPSRSQFIRDALEIAKKRGGWVPKTFESADQSLTRLLKNLKPLSTEGEEFFTVALETLWAQPKEAPITVDDPVVTTDTVAAGAYGLAQVVTQNGKGDLEGDLDLLLRLAVALASPMTTPTEATALVEEVRTKLK